MSINRNYYQYLERDRDSITIYDMNHNDVVTQFLMAIHDAIKDGYKNIEILFECENRSSFPNVIVPITGILDSLRGEGVNFEFIDIPRYVEAQGIVDPACYSPSSPHNILNRVWKCTNYKDVEILSSAYETELRKSDNFGPGVLKSLAWSLTEVLDNVINHSDVSEGYIMGQIQKNNKIVAFTIFDFGRGIYNSLRSSKIHSPRTPVDAITLALKEEVTRDKSIGQGNGLFGLHQIITKGNGRLVIASDKGFYQYRDNRTITSCNRFYYSPIHASTLVDFQLNYGNDLSLEDSLSFRGQAYEITDLQVENLEDDNGYIIYSVKENSEGTGTRVSAERAKNEILNLYTETNKVVVVDFNGISIITSSFADELIAKLVFDLGFFQFNNIIRLKGLDMTNQKILQRSIIQRMVSYLNEPDDKDIYF